MKSLILLLCIVPLALAGTNTVIVGSGGIIVKPPVKDAAAEARELYSLNKKMERRIGRVEMKRLLTELDGATTGSTNLAATVAAITLSKKP